MTRSKPDRLLGQLLQGTYRLERVLGTGGTAVVYEAAHRRLARRFAVKVLSLRLADNEEALERFRREAMITSGLGHPHILEIVDFNETDDGQPYLVMELLIGETLSERLERKRRLTIAEAGSILRQTSSALQAAHEQGVVHRDLKPSNVFLCRRRTRDDYVKILDFGISKVLGAHVGLTGGDSMVGTPRYMSPEQVLSSADVDLRTDVYSLGAILYEMLAGSPAFNAETVPAVLHMIVNIEAPPCSAAGDPLPSGIEAVVRRALNKNRDLRFSTMDEYWTAFADAAHQADIADFNEPTDDRDELGWTSENRGSLHLRRDATGPDRPSEARTGWHHPVTGPPPRELHAGMGRLDVPLSAIPTADNSPDVAPTRASTGPLMHTPDGITTQLPAVPRRDEKRAPPPRAEEAEGTPAAPVTTLSSSTGEAHHQVIATTLRTPRPHRPLVALLISTVAGLALGSAALGWLWWTQRRAAPHGAAADRPKPTRQLYGVLLHRHPAPDARQERQASNGSAEVGPEAASSDASTVSDPSLAKAPKARTEPGSGSPGFRAADPARKLWLTTRPPGATVRLGDISLGTTPLRGVRIPRRRITLQIGKTGFAVRAVVVAAGKEPARVAGVMLRRLQHTRSTTANRDAGRPSAAQSRDAASGN